MLAIQKFALFKNVSNKLNFLFISEFYTSRTARLNPVVFAVLRPVSKLLAALVGRGIRKWWQSLPDKKKNLFINHVKRHKWKYSGGAGISFICMHYYYDSHVALTPITERRRFMAFSSDQLNKSHPLARSVKRVTSTILSRNRNVPMLYNKTWKIVVIDDPVENCYALPNGQIVVYRGIIELCENDDQLATILAHEISHAILEHGAEQLSRAYFVDLLILFPLAFIWAFLPNDGIAAVTHWFLNKVSELLLKLPYSRELEVEADQVGLMLCAAACFDVREASVFWGQMKLMNKYAENKFDIMEEFPWLSTHPSYSDRQKVLDDLMENALKIRDLCKCPELKKFDPRQPIKLLLQKTDKKS